MSKVSCSMCINYDNGKCLEKNVSVAPNKKRHCDLFIIDTNKINKKSSIPTIRGQHQSVAKKLRYEARKEMKKMIIEAERDKRNLEDSRKYMGARSYNEKHPLTGDLSKFTTTANQE